MSRPWMAFYPADYLADTGHLTLAEHGAYLLLIFHYWNKGSLPTDERQLARIVRASPDEWAQMRDVISEFFTEDWRHKRIEKEIARSELRYAQRLEASRRGVEARAKLKPTGKPSDTPGGQPSGKASGKPSGQPTTITTTVSTNVDTYRARGQRLPDDFEPDISQAIHLGLSGADARREAERFKDYYRSQPGQRGIKTDWPATWRNWCRKAADTHSNLPTNSKANRKRNYVDAALDMMRGNPNGHESNPGDHGNVELLPPGRQ